LLLKALPVSAGMKSERWADGPLFGVRKEEGAGRSVPAARKEGRLRAPPALRMLSCPDLPRP
jgi:hypothetical protein